jgi:hypothetical protein
MKCFPSTNNLRLFFIIGMLIFIQAAFFSGCSSFSVDSTENSSWKPDEIEKAKGTIRIVSVSADKAGEWGSLEKEINDLLPLLFSEESYFVVPASEEADYSVEVKAREREYPEGWRTKRSLSVEVRLWAGNSDGPLPLAAGRSLIHGTKSLASSKTLNTMLRKAIRLAVRRLGAPSRAGVREV